MNLQVGDTVVVGHSRFKFTGFISREAQSVSPREDNLVLTVGPTPRTGVRNIMISLKRNGYVYQTRILLTERIKIPIRKAHG